MAEPPAKRRRLSPSGAGQDTPPSSAPGPASLTRTISPPLLQRASTTTRAKTNRKLVNSPFQLTTIRDLPENSNVDAVSLYDLLGDPLISDCWEFNYLHDVDFLMDHFDEDTRELVNVHIVHGFWKREDPGRLLLQEQASRRKNVTLHSAYMPEMFGTHHSKMMILFRHDDTAQVIIHTANMISKDWTNMTNAVWQSPHLPLSKESNPDIQPDMTMGSGGRFKSDLLSYLRAYNTQRDVCRSLIGKLTSFNFSSIRASLVASVPGRHPTNDDPQAARWGWPGVKHALRFVPIQDGSSEIVVQISSIATLGGTDSWLQNTLFSALSTSAAPSSNLSRPKPSFRVIFPTPDEIRRSLDGYASGGSIHTKVASAQQVKQLAYLHPLFCHWANDSPDGTSNGADSPSSALGSRDAQRKRAAPHIKTYIRYNAGASIDWALLTSANLSKQAWGEAASSGTIRIASWEVGVLVWPELIAGAKGARMVGVFGQDMPAPAQGAEEDDTAQGPQDSADCPLVGLRIPYNLPLQRYGPAERPWVATANYSIPDWMGRTWES